MERYFWTDIECLKKNLKNEEEKDEDFFYWTKNLKCIFFWNFQLCWFQIYIQIFHIFLRSKVTAIQRRLKNGEKCLKLSKMDPLWGGDFWFSRKNLHFFLFNFSSSFSNLLKIFKALYLSSTQKYVSNELLLLIFPFKKQCIKMCQLQ